MNAPTLFPMENPGIRALSWKEPYCILMMLGKEETRTWPTSYRGLVLMCASKVPYTPQTVMHISGGKQYDRITGAMLVTTIHPLGHAKLIGELVNCRPMTEHDEDSTYVQYRLPWTEERTAGKTGKTKVVEIRLWVHVYENVRAIEPIPWEGCQGWKKLPIDFLSKVKYL